MRFQMRTASCRFALLVCSISLAVAQDTRPEVPNVPTTDEAVQAMLKLADVKEDVTMKKQHLRSIAGTLGLVTAVYGQSSPGGEVC